MPDHTFPSYLPYWKRNIETGEIFGYYVDLLHELSRYAGFNFTLKDSSEFLTYDSLGKIQINVEEIGSPILASCEMLIALTKMIWEPQGNLELLIEGTEAHRQTYARALLALSFSSFRYNWQISSGPGYRQNRSCRWRPYCHPRKKCHNRFYCSISN